MLAEDKWAELGDPEALRKKLGLPHPLWKFALPNFQEIFADILLDAIKVTTLCEPESMYYKGAAWLLLESEAYFYVCEMAGVDGPKLRAHLRNKIPTCR